MGIERIRVYEHKMWALQATRTEVTYGNWRERRCASIHAIVFKRDTLLSWLLALCRILFKKGEERVSERERETGYQIPPVPLSSLSRGCLSAPGNSRSLLLLPPRSLLTFITVALLHSQATRPLSISIPLLLHWSRMTLVYIYTSFNSACLFTSLLSCLYHKYRNIQ